MVSVKGKRKAARTKEIADEGVARVHESTAFLRTRMRITPQVGMILGTGLGNLANALRRKVRIPYESIPHYPRSTIQGHRGTLVSGALGGVPTLVMEGRFHIYEGYSPQEVAFPVRVMARLGVRTLLISSAAGGLNPLFEPGDLMMVTDHINLTGMNPLLGPNLDLFGPRFPDMSKAYDKRLLRLASAKALEMGIPLKQGVYAGILGPSLETPAETRFLRMIGADAVGMSTVPEVITAVHSGMKVMVIAAITNVNLPDCMRETSIEEVIARAEEAGRLLAPLWERIVSSLEL
ncbi:MAG: purine-nucleoside phosphorylase [Deltaproteobacteria bacterium]|nr:purine-nucleoside phosphorylase [Deltaproteobacteria bacterium]